ncbi:MAG TPA: allophanate hydrolase [Polyangiaceae bacterium]
MLPGAMSRPRDVAMPLDLASLRAAYETNALSPTLLIETLYDELDDTANEAIWIHRVTRAAARDAARKLERMRDQRGAWPLYGVPFAVKDNIDVEGLPTTAGCPPFAYVAERTAPVVARLLDAGALLLGKTNLDQFATGLVGTRSPYGVPTNPFDVRYITGGSSSGSAVAVARGLVSFALGTDTAGSGRVPAAFTHLVGVKPSRGLVSTTGVVPACRSLDCVSIFALTCEDARHVAQVVTAFDASDPYARVEADGYAWQCAAPSRPFDFAAAREEDIAPYVDGETLRGFEIACRHLEALGGRMRRIDLTPFFEAARLLYDGPWIAERLEPREAFLAEHPEAFLPITRQILEGGHRWRGPEVFAGIHRLEELKQEVRPLFADIEALLLPTAPTLPRIEDVAADPLGSNAKLGRYTNFVNLLDLAAISVPAKMRSDGLPLGVTLIGPWGSDAKLLALASALHRRTSRALGATNWPMPSAPPPPIDRPATRAVVPIAVAGAHLAGQPLNHQLTERSARFVRAVRTAPQYRLFALATTPPKPGLVRVRAGETGFAIDVEIWELPRTELGAFVAHVTEPLCLGTLELEDGGKVLGFLCETYATTDAPDISRFGGWRSFLSSTR